MEFQVKSRSWPKTGGDFDFFTALARPKNVFVKLYVRRMMEERPKRKAPCLSLLPSDANALDSRPRLRLRSVLRTCCAVVFFFLLTFTSVTHNSLAWAVNSRVLIDLFVIPCSSDRQIDDAESAGWSAHFSRPTLLLRSLGSLRRLLSILKVAKRAFTIVACTQQKI